MKKIIIILLLISISWPVMPMEFLKSMVVASMAGPIERKTSEQEASMRSQTEQKQVQKTDAASVVLPPIGGPTTINLNVTMNQHAPMNNHIETNSNTQAYADSTAYAKSKSEAHADVEVSQAMWNMHQESMQTWWADNKLYCGICVLGALYSYYCYQVICGNFYLKRTDLWSSWKHELSFDQLCAIPQQTLARELLFTVQHQGLDMQKPTDFMSPLVMFLQSIEQERTTLLYYQTLHRRISMIKCSIFFPFNHKRYTRIAERLQRLSLVKNIFISWMAEFNIEHARSFY